MKVQIKITNLEISIDTDEPATIVENTIQALRAAVQPMLASTKRSKALKAEPSISPEQEEPEPAPTTPAPIAEEEPKPTAEPTLNGHDTDAAITGNPYRMDFHKFDTLIRAEMARLAPEPGVMPSYELWNAQRSPSLLSWNTILNRYGCATTKSLAEKLGMKTTKRGPKPEVA